MKKPEKIALIFSLLLIIFFILIKLNVTQDNPSDSVWDDYISYKTKGESCLSCHTDTKGYSDYHSPELIGCASCHLGNIKRFNKDDAHEGMILIPGNLNDAKATCGSCHPNELKKVEASLMTTNSGIVAVDKFVFGEADSPDYHYHIKDIQNSASDKHLRDLCANCHLGLEKEDYGPIGQLSRGGGCIACHLNYSEKAISGLNEYLSSDKTELPKFHPSVDIFVSNTHCFGCHSRSSRISTNYEGWQETLLDEEDIQIDSTYRVLEDKRVYARKTEDVHHNKGMLCIDCHSSHEVMGNGQSYLHEEQAVTLQCSDCHFKEKPNTIPYDELDEESLLVWLHREYDHTDKQIIKVEKDGHPLVNTYVDSLGNAFLLSKNDKAVHEIKPQSEICSRDMAHQNVSCSTCHSSWVPRCIGCHNAYDAKAEQAFDLLDRKYVMGQWKEYVAEFGSSLPAMGIREHDGSKQVEPAVPGMILTIDHGSFQGKAEGEDVDFHRLYAPNSPHTTTKEVRDCKSCHANSASLGYGKGKLRYEIENNRGKWLFTPEYALNENDGLPEDAWIPFLKPVHDSVVNSTRTDFRPFTVNEQKRILTLGACLSCHKDDSEVMKSSLTNGFEFVLNRRTRDCVLPVWD
ncbi:MAG: hypothetical protein HKO96_02325 [Flavobacteriaceae bacterium]|nr:hypothetical protein [Flavobacteriaceae bacterium]